MPNPLQELPPRAASANHGLVARAFPAVGWLAAYDPKWLEGDFVAGLIAAGVVVPQAMAYAPIAGLALVAGLYTALVPLVVNAVRGTSRPLSMTTTLTIAILTAGALHSLVPQPNNDLLLSASATLAVLVGVVLVMASRLRLGIVASFIPERVLVGFKAGVGFLIVVDQIPKLLAVHFEKAHFFQNVASDCSAIPDFEYTALKMLAEAERKLRQAGISLWLAALNPEPLPLIHKLPLGTTTPGRARMWFNLGSGCQKFSETLRERAARRCPDRMFTAFPTIQHLLL